jgi:PKD repeat protein
MQNKSWGVFTFILGIILALSLAGPASAEDEVFVVSSSLNGDANYMQSFGDGSFDSQQILRLITDTTIDVPYKYSYGNGLGDFDGDGDLDYITGIGYGTGNIYIYEKLGAGNDFADPVYIGTWGVYEGYFPMDFAVGDFNEDGKDDFVLSLGYSYASELYLSNGGTGTFEFVSRLLPGTAAYSSSGADAADFNGDGHADFVIAASSNEKMMVSLGDGKGNFTTSSFDVLDVDTGFNDPVFGVAAADFTGDGVADIAAAASDFLYIYEGAGDGITFHYAGRQELPLNYSTIDNDDFDGDRIQDLVIAGYGDAATGVSVLLGDDDGEGNSDGTFTYSDTYLGGSSRSRNAVTGSPWKPVTNVDPVAVIEPAVIEVTAGQEVVFDGSASFDEDGEIVGYEWDFGDGNANAGVMTLSTQKTGGKNPSYTYYDKGVYTVTLVVTDNQGAKSTFQAEVHVAAVKARVVYSPRRLNLQSRGKWIVATIKLPRGYNPAGVDPASLSISTGESGPIYAEVPQKRSFLTKLWKKIQRRFRIVTVRFDRQEVLAAISEPSKNTVLKLEGDVFHNNGWVKFEGSGKIKTYGKKKKWSFWSKYISKNKYK